MTKKKPQKKIKKETIEKKTEKLYYIVLNDFSLIPEHLMKRLSKEYNIDSTILYKYNDQIFSDGTQQLFLMRNNEYKIKGFIWTSLNVFNKIMNVNVCILDKDIEDSEYNNIYIKLKEMKENTKLNNVLWTTDNPKKLEEYGFRRTKKTLMEI